MDGHVDGKMTDRCLDEWTYRHMNRQIDRQMDGYYAVLDSQGQASCPIFSEPASSHTFS